jgi:hypothetical protein
MQNPIKRSHLEVTFVCIVLFGSIAFLCLGPKQKSKVYDCSLSEISPDYPIEVKQQCRALRAENINKDLQKPK